MTNKRFYIPVNEEVEEEVNEALRGQTFIADRDSFIALYNQGVINTNNPTIEAIAKTIAASYTNVILQNKKFYVSSAQETYAEKAIFVLNTWKLVLTLKRIANDIINEGLPLDTKLVFNLNHPGSVFLEEFDPEAEETHLVKYEAAERFTTKKDDIVRNILLRDKIQLIDENDDEKYFILAQDLIAIDSSFIDDINTAVDNAAKGE